MATKNQDLESLEGAPDSVVDHYAGQIKSRLDTLQGDAKQKTDAVLRGSNLTGSTKEKAVAVKKLAQGLKAGNLKNVTGSTKDQLRSVLMINPIVQQGTDTYDAGCSIQSILDKHSEKPPSAAVDTGTAGNKPASGEKQKTADTGYGFFDPRTWKLPSKTEEPSKFKRFCKGTEATVAAGALGAAPVVSETVRNFFTGMPIVGDGIAAVAPYVKSVLDATHLSSLGTYLQANAETIGEWLATNALPATWQEGLVASGINGVAGYALPVTGSALGLYGMGKLSEWLHKWGGETLPERGLLGTMLRGAWTPVSLPWLGVKKTGELIGTGLTKAGSTVKSLAKYGWNFGARVVKAPFRVAGAVLKSTADFVEETVKHRKTGTLLGGAIGVGIAAPFFGATGLLGPAGWAVAGAAIGNYLHKRRNLGAIGGGHAAHGADTPSE